MKAKLSFGEFDRHLSVAISPPNDHSQCDSPSGRNMVSKYGATPPSIEPLQLQQQQFVLY